MNKFYRLITAQFEMILKDNKQKEMRAAELMIANKELVFQNKKNEAKLL